MKILSSEKNSEPKLHKAHGKAPLGNLWVSPTPTVENTGNPHVPLVILNLIRVDSNEFSVFLQNPIPLPLMDINTGKAAGFMERKGLIPQTKSEVCFNGKRHEKGNRRGVLYLRKVHV
jgi:hypothetical protein